MKLLMATRADVGTYPHLDFTLPMLRTYAEKWGAESLILDKSYGSVFWRWQHFYRLLDEYDRIFHIDADVIITKTCPNIFEVVPYDTIGLVFEDKGSRLNARRTWMAHINKIYGGNEDWTAGYLNGGMFVVSRPHKELFTKINGKLWGEDIKVHAREQTHLNYQIMKQNHKYIDLGFRFNHMSMFSENWNGGPSRFNSHIIHYAGKAHFPDKGSRSREQLMKDDFEEIYHGHLG